jgi:uncharacterized protein (TIGR01319 family)
MSEIRRMLESILVVDCGTTTTKAVLLDLVAGEYRMVAYAQAPSTAYRPWEDVSAGVVSALARLQAISGRALLDDQSQPITPEREDGSGVDRLLAISSAANPLRVLIAGLIDDVSLASARRAALSTCSKIVGVIASEHRADGSDGDSSLRSDGSKIDAVHTRSADVILMVGGTDGGATGPVLAMAQDILRVALYGMGERAPFVLYAGNRELSDQVTRVLQDVASVQVVDNVRPTLDVEDISPAHSELDVLFYERHMRAIPGIRRLRVWTPSIILPTARAADYAIRYLARTGDASKAVLGVDVGSSSVTLNVAQGEEARTTIRTDLGMGYSLIGLLEQVDMDDILRWLPFEIDPFEARDRLLNKALHPHIVPQTREDLLLEHAAAREMLRLTLVDALPGWPGQVGGAKQATLPACDPIVAGGGVLAHVPHLGQAALILLDALQPVGTSTIYLDTVDLLAALGTVANVEPLATVQMLRGDALRPVGVVVVPHGRARPGDKVLTIRSAAEPENVYLEVRHGDLGVVSPPVTEPETLLELVPSRGLDVGNGPGKRVQMSCLAGSLGLIVDARGRPLVLDGDPETRRQSVSHWLYQMTGERGA